MDSHDRRMLQKILSDVGLELVEAAQKLNDLQFDAGSEPAALANFIRALSKTQVAQGFLRLAEKLA